MAITCPQCNSTKTQKYGTYTLTGGKQVQKRKCTSCGHVFFEEEAEQVFVIKEGTQ